MIAWRASAQAGRNLMQSRRTMMMLAGVSALALGTAATPAHADVTLGLAIGISGQCAAIGQQAKRGAEQAVADINAKGGVLGQKLVLDEQDDACDPKQAVTVANKLVDANVPMVIGHLYSGASIAAAGVYSEAGIVMMSPSATNPELTEKGLKTIFRACGRDDQQGAVSGAYIADHFKGKRIALLDDKSAYGHGLTQEVAKVLTARGIKPVLVDSITAGEKDYSSIISRLKSAGVEVLYYGGYYPEAGLMLRQAHDQGYQLQLIGADGLQASDLWNIAGPAANGTLFTFTPDASASPAARPVLAEFKAAGFQPDNFAFYYYAGVQVAAQAIEKAHAAKAAAIVKALRADTFDTVVGKEAFDAKGDLKNPSYVVYEWRNGQTHVVSQ